MRPGAAETIELCAGMSRFALISLRTKRAVSKYSVQHSYGI